MKFFDDIEVGAREVLGHHTFGEAEMIAFARAYDPQPFHVDPEAAKRSHFGALVASGWYTASLWMRYFVGFNVRTAEAQRARGERVPVVGPSPGFSNLHWLKPVYAGDTITYATEAREKTVSRSKSHWGILKAYNSGTNQYGDLVIDFESVVLLERRGS
ncbi:MaoC family dehydratase [Xanthobacter dioxanivorans]|uniref:MaoC family dehydratase n=1 Tax=Xanthobacter dioxanivorans TaxID=2528964 RepID=A0A974SLD7_9HYPH|nr:MaoC family dehydratase [Xanthobacter dioxanivorans]QRG09204.1 MaoC family dehydratase [Xanthobacter dioxanivorans]